MNERNRFAVKEGTFAYIYTIFGAIVRYGNNLILTRILGASNFGLYSLANTIVSVITIITSFGFPSSIVHFVAKEKEKGNIGSMLWFIKKTLKFTLLISTLLMLMLLIFSKFIAFNFYKKEGLFIPLIGLSLSIPFISLYNVKSSILQGFMQIRKRVFLEKIAHPLFYSTLLLILLFFRRDFYIVLFFFVLSALIVFILSSYWVREVLKNFSVEGYNEQHYRELFSFSLPVLFLNFLSFFVLQSDIIVMGLFLEPREVGIYAIASRLALGVGMPADSLGASLAPHYSALTGKNDREGLSSLYKTSTRWIFTFSSLISLILLFGANLILSLFGKDFSEGRLILFILTFGQLFSAAFGTNGTLITQSGHPKLNLFNALMVGSLNLVLLFYLVPRIHSIGAAFASASSLVLLNILRSLEIGYVLRISPFNKTILKPLISLILSLIVGFTFFTYSEILSLIMAPLFFIIILVLLRFEKEDKEILSLALNRIGIKFNG